MAIDKRISYDVQGGVKNYLGKQKEVKAPVKWQSSPDHPETELAYITKAEKDLLIKKDLHGSLKGSVNRGPSGIISLNGYGSIEGGRDVGMSGSATSAAETGSRNARDVRDVQAQMNTANLGPSIMPQGAQDYRSEFIAAGGGQRVNPGFFDSRNVVSPQELALARAYDPAGFRASRRSGIMDFFTSGGLLGNIIRSIGQKFGLGKTYDQPTYDMSRYSNLPLGGSSSFQNLDIRDKFDRRFKDGINFTDANARRLMTQPGFTPQATVYDPYGIKVEDGRFSYDMNKTSLEDFKDGIMTIPINKPQYFENVPYQEPDFYSNAMAEITPRDEEMMQTPVGQMMDYDTFKTISGNDTLTQEEFEQLQKKYT